MGMAYVMKNWTYMSVILMEEIVVKQLLGILDVTKRDAIVIYLVFQLHLFSVIQNIFLKNNWWRWFQIIYSLFRSSM